MIILHIFYPSIFTYDILYCFTWIQRKIFCIFRNFNLRFLCKIITYFLHVKIENSSKLLEISSKYIKNIKLYFFKVPLLLNDHILTCYIANTIFLGPWTIQKHDSSRYWKKARRILFFDFCWFRSSKSCNSAKNFKSSRIGLKFQVVVWGHKKTSQTKFQPSSTPGCSDMGPKESKNSYF